MGVVVKRVVIGDTVTDMSPVWWHSDCDCSGESCGGIGLDKKKIIDGDTYCYWHLTCVIILQFFPLPMASNQLLNTHFTVE